MNSQEPPDQPLRLLILGAHPDDAEFHAGGFASVYRRLEHTVKMVSVTDGGAGHHRLKRDELVAVRKQEAAAAGAVIGATYEVWDNPDGRLQPTIQLREQIIREIRRFQPDLVLTHRPNDYHPDHRAVGQAVQDASYMVTVPLVAPDTPHLRQDPVVAYMPDLFTKPAPLTPQIVLDCDGEIDNIVQMLACHQSQVFDFLPYNARIEDQVPTDPDARLAWLKGWYDEHSGRRADHFRDALIKAYGAERGLAIQYAEAYEISEYAGDLDNAARQRLFPFAPAG